MANIIPADKKLLEEIETGYADMAKIQARINASFYLLSDSVQTAAQEDSWYFRSNIEQLATKARNYRVHSIVAKLELIEAAEAKKKAEEAADF